MKDLNVENFTPYKNFASIVVSTPEIVFGESYKIYYDGSSIGEFVDGVYINGEYTAGILFNTFTINSMVTKINVRSGGMGRP